MKIEIEPTDQLVTSNGSLCQIWTGETESGIPIEAFVQCVKVESSESARFFAEMKGKVFETDAPLECP